MEHGYCINLKNGMIIQRFIENAERDNACVLFAPISDKVAQAIFDKKVTAADVIRAINNRIRTSDEFDLEKYIEERVKMNVRIQDVDLEKLAEQQENGVKEAPIPDKSNVTLDEINHARDARKAEGKPKAEKAEGKPKAEKAEGKPKAENAEGKPKAENAEGKPKAENAEGKPKKPSSQSCTEAAGDAAEGTLKI